MDKVSGQRDLLLTTCGTSSTEVEAKREDYVVHMLTNPAELATYCAQLVRISTWYMNCLQVWWAIGDPEKLERARQFALLRHV